MRIAHNVIMDIYRDHKSDHTIDVNEDNDLSNISSDNVREMNIEQAFVNNQVLRDVKKIMGQLPNPQREVVYMRYYQQMSFKEIADVTNVSINTALGRMRYAILNMRRMAREHNIALEMY